jgi:tetratricopeptide (TPR) repeat protein
MPRLNPIALSVTCALVLGGCAAPMKQEAGQPPAVQPVLSVNPPITPQGMYRLGRYFEGQGRHDKAIAAYRQALKLDPLLVEAYTGLGMALAAQGRHDEAIREFEAAVVLAPYLVHLHNNLGYAYMLSGRTTDAINALEQARRLDPSHEKARDNLRLAEAKLAPAGTTPEPAKSGQAASGLRMVEVSPRVFELRMPARHRPMEARPLPPLQQKVSSGGADLLQKETSAERLRAFNLEVANGNGVLGLAKRTAGYLADGMIQVTRLTNQLPFNQATTEIQYRDGYAAEARALAARLEQPPRIVPSKQLAGRVDVRLVLGRDLQQQVVVRVSARPKA